MNRSIPPQAWRWVYLAAWVAAAVFVLLALGQWWSAGLAADRLGALVSRMDEPGNAADLSDEPQQGSDGPGDTALPEDDPGQLAAQRINERYVFHPEPQPPSHEIRGVLGNTALFVGGGAVPVGGEFNGATVLAVGGNWAELEFEGEKRKVYVAGGSPGGGNSGRRGRGPRPPQPPPQVVAAANTSGDTAPAPGGPRRITRDDIDPAKIAAKYGIPVAMVEQQLSQVSDEQFQQGLEEAGDDINEFLKD